MVLPSADVANVMVDEGSSLCHGHLLFSSIPHGDFNPYDYDSGIGGLTASVYASDGEQKPKQRRFL
jgi:hypothetical protein